MRLTGELATGSLLLVFGIGLTLGGLSIAETSDFVFRRHRAVPRRFQGSDVRAFGFASCALGVILVIGSGVVIRKDILEQRD